MSVAASPRLYFEPLKLLNFDFNADPDPSFHTNADPDPDPASKNNVDPTRPDPDPQHCNKAYIL